MMRLWKVALLVNLAFVLGAGLGYLRWGREVAELRQELARAREAASQAQAGARAWTVRGIVRSVIPQHAVAFITHETIPGLMPGMTMPFEAETPKTLEGITPGDRVRFTIVEKGKGISLVAIAKDPAQ